MRKGIVNDEISYDFSERMFTFICLENNNVAQYYLMSQKEKDVLIAIIKPSVCKIVDNKYVVTMI